MKEQFKKILDQAANIWKKMSVVQKIMSAAIAVVVIAAFIMLSVYNSSPSMISVLTSPVKDENLLNTISIRMDEEGVEHTISADGMIFVKDLRTAQRVVSILAREDLIPKTASPWDVFKMDRWTVTDFERNVNLRRAITLNLQAHLESLEDIDSADISLVLPENELFAEDQKKVSASIIITPRPGSDIRENRKKIEGIVKLVKFAVEGLDDDYITITDHQGHILNDFTGLAEFDRLELTKREMKIKSDLEKKLSGAIKLSLRQIFGQDRVEIINLDIDLDMGKKKIETEEHFPVTMKADNPSTPFDETEVVPSITISKNLVDESFRGTGFNPEGPPGQEGQTPPAYKDLEGMVGEYKRNNVIQNEVVNTKNITEEKSPWGIKRITVGVAIDGIWRWEYDDSGLVKLNKDGSIVRNYENISDVDLAKAKTLVEHAIGFNKIRGDSVTVQSLQFDRSKQFQLEDQKYRNRMRVRQMIIYSIIGTLLLIVFFIVFRIVIKTIERKRKLREEELARQHQAMREAALRSAEEDGVSVEMSVEDRARIEMQENAINMAREHPEDVAQLIRTWLLEE
ncbi:MAG: flagellar M-ring protein FliF [Spirochaetales bacterium]|nr:flagellar M-ring protein FliF [Spirochaetales bacterium]